MWDVDKTSQQITVPKATLRYWRHIGYGSKSFKIGRRVVYKRSDVEQWIEEQYN
jgi:DNA-binding transcriptional MerR regulator